MDRRTALGVLSTLLVTGPVRAQPASRPIRIGVITSGFSTAELSGPQPANETMRMFLAGMRDQGYEYGRDFVTEPRGGEGRTERYPALAAELVSAAVDVIVAGGPTLPAVAQATSTIPIVMVGGALDPVRDGIVRSLGQPGGNITGLSIQQVDTTPKRLEILKEVAPASVVGVLWESTSRSSWAAAESAARMRGWNLVSVEVTSTGSIERALATATAAKATAFLVVSGGRLFGQRQRVVDLVATTRAPAIYGLEAFVQAGGLMSYGANLEQSWRRSAAFVDRIIKGARPADLPVEQSTKFDLVVNQRTAKALGIALPRSLLLRADRVIE